MDELVKSMLSICTRFTPNNRPRSVRNSFHILGYRLSITFHIALLKIGGKSVHVLIVRQHGCRFSTEKISIPNAQHCQHNGQIFLQRSRSKMSVHIMGALQ